MKALTPEPIDRERAKKDVAYFAKMYLDVKLADWQIKMVESIIDGENTTITGGNREARRVAADVGVAMARHKGYRVKVVQDKDFIDV